MAMRQWLKHSSLGTVTLASGYTSGSGSMSLTAGHGARLPSSGDFWLTADVAGTFHVWKVTARSTDTLTVTADATEGGGDTNLSGGQTLKVSETISALEQLIADNCQRGAIASATSTKAGRLYTCSDAGQLLRDNGSSFDYHAGLYPHEGVPQTGWSWDNQDSATQITGNGRWGHTKFGAGGNATFTWQYRTAPSPPYTVIMRMHRYVYHDAGNAGWCVGFRDSAGKYVGLHNASGYIATSKFSSANVTAGDYSVFTWNNWIRGSGYVPMVTLFAKLEDNNTNLIFYVSPDGYMWHEVDSRARGDYLGTIDGVAFGSRGNTVGVTIDAWRED